MRVLFSASLGRPAASGRQRCDALARLGHDVVTFPFDGFDRRSALTTKVRRIVGAPFFLARDLERIGRKFVSTVEASGAEVVWVEKPLMLLPEFVSAAKARSPGSLFVCFQDDDPFGLRHWERPTWKHFVDAIPEYDVHFVKRQQNISEFQERGARNVLLFMHGVHSPLFYPRRTVPAWARQEISFTGTPLDHRVVYIAQLLRLRLPVEIYGSRWRRELVYWRFPRHFHPEIAGEQYAALLSGSKICLGFVSSKNRDQYSMRSFEIPGSGSLLLAERTPAHQELYEEGLEAEFFESAEECESKCRFYLRHDGARERVARAGRERCLRSDYSLERRMRDALSTLRALEGS